MSLPSTIGPPAESGTGPRFFLMGHLPLYAALLFLLMLFWSGARAWREPVGGGPSPAAAWETAGSLRAGELVVLVLAVMLAAVLLQPLQLPLIRLLEGGRPRLPGAGATRRRQLARKRSWEAAAALPPDGVLAPEQVQRAGAAGHELRRRFPLPDHLVTPTALGNALAAIGDRAGRPYGLDAVAAWPRLYSVLGEQHRALVDDRRDTVDTAARMCAVMALTAPVSAVLLARSGWWLALALVPLALSWISYRGAVQAALAYGESVQVAFDLHRFDLLAALRLAAPAGQADERALNVQLSDLWRQGVPLDPALRYSLNGDAE
ncbi:hypothetical protein [Streptomyces litchfieldiae]|uniref:TIGR04222 domain-containing membrane protein n=1 Tax=Streptomyces litchfieldiae TaxID=3075543 RepID=A0ABU2MQI8_9ACTN|nr:hypothetical protein [Streptomyces sp. DSM 44938]MDT0343879.1 hypothetical protein [Streptomyces sp. DSM 44938]